MGSYKYGSDSIQAYWDGLRGNYSWTAPFTGDSAGSTSAEDGWGMWIDGPEFVVDENNAARWKSRAFIGTRVPALNHSMCCCQYMVGDSATFHLTEYCRAKVPGLSKTLLAACAPYNSPCPRDNETAFGMTWTFPMYIESYRACMAPLPRVVDLP